jgi:hypothetical protein
VAEAKCEHGMPSPASCVDCMYEGDLPPPPKPVPPTVEVMFTAVFEGHCRGCDEPIEVGQRICKLSDGTCVHMGHEHDV